MPENHLKSIFDSLKKAGSFPQYADYEEYKKDKWGFGEPEQQNQLEKPPYQAWKDEMPEEERKQFDTLFDENEN